MPSISSRHPAAAATGKLATHDAQMHTPSPQFLSDATGSDVQFPVSRNAARRSVHCHSRGLLEWECFLLTTE